MSASLNRSSQDQQPKVAQPQDDKDKQPKVAQPQDDKDKQPVKYSSPPPTQNDCQQSVSESEANQKQNQNQTGQQHPYGQPQQDDSYQVQDKSSGQNANYTGQQHQGNQQSEYCNISKDDLQITACKPSSFIQGGDGNNTESSSGGSNVLASGSGNNTFNCGGDTDQIIIKPNTLVAARDVVNGFHSGDDLMLYGASQGNTTTQWQSSNGGVDLVCKQGQGTNTVHFGGMSMGDVDSGKLSCSFGATQGGQSYLDVHCS
jgi:hypothetical protein